MIHSNIKVLMKEKKLNVREFAEMTGMSTATINKARRDNGTRRQDIEIYYSFVGKIDLPE